MWGSLGHKALIFKNHWASDVSAVNISATESEFKVVDVYFNYGLISLAAHQTEQMSGLFFCDLEPY